MSFLKLIVCMLLAFSLAGCAVSKNPNPMIRYGANTAATMAVPGAVVTAVSVPIIATSGVDGPRLVLAIMGVGAAGIGYVAGALIGGTVGLVKWMINGFEDDRDTGYELPEEILPPER